MRRLLIVVVVVAVAAIIGVSVGFASNTIPTNLIEIGSGEADIKSPITTANISFELAKELRDPTPDQPDSADEFFMNLITACKFHSPENLPESSMIICKLTDLPDEGKQFGDPVAAGLLVLNHDYVASTVELIPLTQIAFPDANDVQKIHDVKMIVLGPEPHMIFESEITGANVDFEINVKLVDPTPDQPNSGDEKFVTVIEKCSFDLNRDLRPGSLVICMLTDLEGDVIAEGSLDFPSGYVAGTKVFIPITEFAFPDANDVQKVHDVRIKVFEPGEGCTPGFWKTHATPAKNAWIATGFNTSDKFEDVFSVDLTGDLDGITLLQAVNLGGGVGGGVGGGDVNALIRHATASLLNAAHPDIDVADPDIDIVLEVKAVFQDAFNSGDPAIIEATKNKFAASNGSFCPLG